VGRCSARRIARYRELAERRGYGEKSLAEYDPDLWFAGAIKEDVRGLRDRGDFTLARWDPLTDVYTWKDSKNYHQTPWYCFQKAVKDHQNEDWEVLSRANLMGLECRRCSWRVASARRWIGWASRNYGQCPSFSRHLILYTTDNYQKGPKHLILDTGPNRYITSSV
jgi:hypothetical protein